MTFVDEGEYCAYLSYQQIALWVIDDLHQPLFEEFPLSRSRHVLVHVLHQYILVSESFLFVMKASRYWCGLIIFFCLSTTFQSKSYSKYFVIKTLQKTASNACSLSLFNFHYIFYYNICTLFNLKYCEQKRKEKVIGNANFLQHFC